MFIKCFKHRQMSYSIVKELEKTVEFDFGNSLLIYCIRLLILEETLSLNMTFFIR